LSEQRGVIEDEFTSRLEAHRRIDPERGRDLERRTAGELEDPRAVGIDGGAYVERAR
jgi:hypothetical protein